MPETKPSSKPDEPTPPSNRPNENSQPSGEENSELTELRELNSRLVEQIEFVSEQLAACEARLAQMTAVVAENSEDLQRFGTNWFRPSAVASITRESSAGVCLNGHPIGWNTSGQEDSTAQQMRQIAEYINRQNAAKRKAAGLPEPEPMEELELPDQPEERP